MAINKTPVTFGYVLIAIGIVAALGLAYGVKKTGRFKLSHIALVVIAIGLGIKFALAL